jgi:hypothetical protein
LKYIVPRFETLLTAHYTAAFYAIKYGALFGILFKKELREEKSVLWIRIGRIRMFLGLTDPDPLAGGKDPDPDPSLFS